MISTLSNIQETGFLAWLESGQWQSPQQDAFVFQPGLYDLLTVELDRHCDDAGYLLDQYYWQRLRQALRSFAEYQQQRNGAQSESGEPFANYAAVYDYINGQDNLRYIAKGLQFFVDTFDRQFASRRILSAGCGTGIVESYMIRTFGVDAENLFGFDLSESMVALAKQRIRAEVLDVVRFEPQEEQWDCCCAWTNVLQYLHYQDLEKAIANLAKALKQGGYFLADFITPDHIRSFPNVLKSKHVSLLRQPSLVCDEQNLCQVTELFNVSKLNEQFIVTYEGRHKRFLPSIWRLRHLFTKYFSRVYCYDALSLEALRHEADTSESTRYLLIARK